LIQRDGQCQVGRSSSLVLTTDVSPNVFSSMMQ
jgi:hypothetical protein